MVQWLLTYSVYDVMMSLFSQAIPVEQTWRSPRVSIQPTAVIFFYADQQMSAKKKGNVMGDYFVSYGLLLVPVCFFGMWVLFGSRSPATPNAAQRGGDNDNPLRHSSSHSTRSVDSDWFDDWTGSPVVNWEPMVNVDGTPMMGDFDIRGNPYGVTAGGFGDDSMFGDDSCSSMFDDDWSTDSSDDWSSDSLDDWSSGSSDDW